MITGTRTAASTGRTGSPKRCIEALLALLVACNTSSAAPEPSQAVLPVAKAKSEPAQATPSAPPAAATIAAERPVPSKGREIAVPAGVVRLGSATGSAERNPAREADDIAIEVPAFSIDALPYPNDPAQAPKTSIARSEAAQLCAHEGKRLCHEIEWERACKGDEHNAYPTSGKFDASACAHDPAACVSPLGVFALGTYGREWTASEVTRGLGDSLRSAVVRGAAKDADPKLHRCAARDAATPDSRSESLIFRCCRGPAPTLSYPSEPERPPFVEQQIAKSELDALLASMPETRDLAGAFRPFSADEVTKALQKAGHSRAGMAPWQPAQTRLTWSPVHGEEVGLLVGDTPKGALLIAYYPLSQRNQFIASYQTKDEHTAMLLAYKLDTPREVLFSTCWGCGGEGGAIVLADDGRVRIVQR